MRYPGRLSKHWPGGSRPTVSQSFTCYKRGNSRAKDKDEECGDLSLKTAQFKPSATSWRLRSARSVWNAVTSAPLCPGVAYAWVSPCPSHARRFSTRLGPLDY